MLAGAGDGVNSVSEEGGGRRTSVCSVRNGREKGGSHQELCYEVGGET